jgi:hypothetical protein
MVHFPGEFGALVYGAVAAGAFDGGVNVAGVTEEHVIGEAIDAVSGELGVLGMIAVAGAAGGCLGETGALGFCGPSMAVCATQLERSVRFVRENSGGPGRPGGYGSE